MRVREAGRIERKVGKEWRGRRGEGGKERSSKREMMRIRGGGRRCEEDLIAGRVVRDKDREREGRDYEGGR